MREGDTFATRFLYGVIVALALFTGFLAAFTVGTQRLEAAGIMADLMCLPKADPPCPCGQSLGPKGCRPDPSNRFGCDCFDETSGFITPGKCVATQKCQASSPAGQPQIPMIPMPPPPMPPSPSTDMPCGFGGPTSAATTSTSTSGCPGGYDFSSSFPTYDYSSIFDSSNTGGISGIDGIGSGINSGASSDPNSVSSLLDGTIDLGGSTQSSGSVVPGGTAANSTPRPPFGSAEGISGDLRLQGTVATLMVSNRDTSRGTQVSGMFGFTVAPGITANTVFKSMCGMRQWANSYLSLIIPSTYFDSLCTARGLALNARVAGSAAGAASSGASSAAAAPRPPAPAPVPPPTPPAYLGELRASIWAAPPAVSVGGRTSIFWDAKGVVSCSITSNDGSFSGSSLSGHGSTLPLTKNTTFSINCQSATSTVSNQVVVTVQ